MEVRAWDVRKPVIAAVNGHALGIGFTMALQCDLRYFAAEAAYGIVQVRRGVMGDAYSHWVLPRLAGMAAAADILLTGRTFDGHEAMELGVCNRVLPNDEVLAGGPRDGPRHRRQHRPTLGGLQQAAAVGRLGSHARRDRAVGDRRPSPPHGSP